MSRVALNRKLGLGVAVATLLGAAVPASAQMRPELGLFFGALFADEELTGKEQDANDINPLIGIRGGLRMNNLVGIFADAVYAPIDAALPVDDASEKLFRGGIEVYGPPHWNHGESFVALAGGIASISIEDEDGISKPMASLGIGQQYEVSDHGRLRWEARGERIFVGDDEDQAVTDDMNQFELLLGGLYSFGGDGPKDSDGDGVLDETDECPKTPRGWAVDSRGCPIDTDGDGVPDGGDKCPGTPKGATVDKFGCPSDSDMDGVFDGIDQCPNTPAGVTVDARGCPMDSDGDGVFDGIDKCPNTPKGVKVDATGCPLAAPLFTPEKKELILEGVNFESNSAKLTADSRDTLEKVSESLRAYPEVRVEVAGHTDWINTDSYNLDLSHRRAQSVVDFIVAEGVDISRISAKGYGEGSPIADNNTSAGRAKNRRVELRKID